MTVPGVLPTPRVPDLASAPPLNWGLIGPGWIARTFTNALHHVPSQRVVAVGSRSIDRAQEFARAHEVASAYGSYAELVADPSVEAVYVASPHSEHAEHALAAIAAGKHVLVEKAFTRNAAEARRVVAAARAAKVTLMEAMWTRFLPRTDILRQLLADGVLGELEMVQGDHGQDLRPENAPRLYLPELAGGALLDLGIYPISLVSMILGTPAKVVAVGSHTDTGVDRQVSAVLSNFAEHPHAQAVVNCTLAAKTPTTASVSGKLARVELDGDFYAPGTLRLVTPDGVSITSAPPQLTGHLGLAYEATHFASLVGEGRTESPLMPPDETVAIMDVLDQIRAQVHVNYPGE